MYSGCDMTDSRSHFIPDYIYGGPLAEYEDRARRIKAIMGANGLNHVDVAEAIGADVGYLRNVLSLHDRSENVIGRLEDEFGLKRADQ